MKLNNFSRYAWGVLAFNVVVILWGAFVRATGSGAGCGQHWPTCNGQVVPLSPRLDTMIEFSHRISSGLAFLMVVVLIVWAFRSYPKGHPVRLGAALSMAFMLSETMVGASLVLFQLVAYNLSVIRAVVMAIHLINTFLLMASITLTAWWASGGRPIQFKGHGKWGRAMLAGFLAMLLLAASGGVTALGDTLFPAGSLSAGIQEELSSTAHFLVRLRVYHPLIAIIVGAYLIMVMTMINAQRPESQSKFLTQIFTGIYVLQLILGAFNVVLLAPVWMQLVHLFVSDLLLIVLVLFIATAFAEPAPDKRSVEATASVYA